MNTNRPTPDGALLLMDLIMNTLPGAQEQMTRRNELIALLAAMIYVAEVVGATGRCLIVPCVDIAMEIIKEVESRP